MKKSNIFLYISVILGLIGTLFSINMIPINSENLTTEQINYLLHEGAINYALGKKLQILALVFLVIYVYFLIKEKLKKRW
ncbi:hypothetical protein CIRMBP1204_02485 [Enterococcus cecorum]|nr:hypothetical protein CIRMBP1204_02485 [Enterococcus cecorum]